MDIGIIGPGAIGTFLAGVLGRYNDVDLLGKRDVNLQTVEVSGKTELETSVKYSTSMNSLSDDELIIICTKSFDTEKAVRSLSDHISPDSYVLSLQNGLNNEKVISECVSEERTIGGITSNGVTYMGPGKVKHAGIGETVIGRYPRGDSTIVDDVSGLFNEAGLKTRTSEEIIVHIWEKAVVNSGINPMTAIMDVRNGHLIEDRYLEELLEKIISESGRIAEKEVETSMDRLVTRTKEVARDTSDNISSMLQDVRNENRTEVEQINGEIIRKGEEFRISTPINETLFSMVKSMENRYMD